VTTGPERLAGNGASLVRGPQDVLELLYTPEDAPARGRAATIATGAVAPHSGLRRELRATLERVGTGCDTPDKLTRAGANATSVLLALSELELMGLLVRGDGGRYLPRDPVIGLVEATRLSDRSHPQERG